jgi:hypothetical protein
VHLLRLTCAEFYVDVRLTKVAHVWLASASTPDGPSLGWGDHSIQALVMALEPFDGAIDQLLQDVSFVDVGSANRT